MYNNKNVVQKIKNSIWGRIALGVMLIGMSMSSQASLLGFDLQDSPDISAVEIDSTYFDVTKVFEAKGYASELNFNDVTYQISGSNDKDYILKANIENDGTFTGGSIEIGGQIMSNMGLPGNYTASSNILLTGDLFQFGSESSGTLDFLFKVTGGDAADLYGGLGSIGVIILRGSGFSTNWGLHEDTTGGQSDNGLRVAVPEPTSMWLLGSGILGLAGFSRRKKNK